MSISDWKGSIARIRNGLIILGDCNCLLGVEGSIFPRLMSLYPYKTEVNEVAGDISGMRKCRQKCSSRNLGLEKKYFGIAECNGNVEKKKLFSCRGSIMKYDYNVFFSESMGFFENAFMTLYLYKPEVSKDFVGTENASAGMLERI